MRRRTPASTRVLPDGTPLRNRLLSALPAADYKRLATHLRLQRRSSARRSTSQAVASPTSTFPTVACSRSRIECGMAHWSRSRPSGAKACSGSASFSATGQARARPSSRCPTVPVVALTAAWFVRATASDGAVSRRDGVATRRRRSYRPCRARRAMPCTM